MKHTPLLLALLLFPFAALAADKDMQLGVDFETVTLDCSITAPLTTCGESANNTNYPEVLVTKRVHSATIRLFAEPSYNCEAFLKIFHPDGRPGGYELLSVYATEQSPGALSIAFPKPILLTAADQLQFQINVKDPGRGGCIGTGTIGVELLTQFNGNIIIR